MKKLILLAIPLLLLSACNKQIEPVKNSSPKETTEIIELENEATVSNLQLLQGFWVSDDDKNSSINFSANTKSDLYENVTITKENFKLYNHYPITKDSQEDENGQYLIVDNIEENFEYKIIELDEKNLTLIYLARGNSLKYYKKNTAEEEFNNSGRAKAIEDETDLWQLYNNSELGISFQYPHYIALLDDKTWNEDPKQTYLGINIKDIGNQSYPMDLSEEEAMETIASLAEGKFGIIHDFILKPSKQVKAVGFLFAQDYMVLARFEVCSVVLERKLVFFFNNKQITMTLHGPTDTLKENMPEYFETNAENCSEMKIWNYDKKDSFYKTLSTGDGSEAIQKWYDDFDKIAETIIFDHK